MEMKACAQLVSVMERQQRLLIRPHYLWKASIS